MMAMRVFAIVVVASVGLPAQTAGPLEFEVASVKPNVAYDRIVNINVGPGGVFTARGYSLKLLIQRAYGIKGYQVSGGPSWLDEDRWDVAARAPRPGAADWTSAQVNSMLQALLAERFGLRTHSETREMRGFALSTINGASRLTVSTATGESIRREGRVLVVEGVTLPSLAVILGSYLGRPVRDETGLAGRYNLRLQWDGRADAVTVDAPAPEESGVSLPRAVTEQLGLRLTGRTVPAQILVIEAARKASASEQ